MLCGPLTARQSNRITQSIHVPGNFACKAALILANHSSDGHHSMLNFVHKIIRLLLTPNEQLFLEVRRMCFGVWHMGLGQHMMTSDPASRDRTPGAKTWSAVEGVLMTHVAREMERFRCLSEAD